MDKELKEEIVVTSDSADENLDRLIERFDELGKKLDGVLTKISSIADSFDKFGAASSAIDKTTRSARKLSGAMGKQKAPSSPAVQVSESVDKVQDASVTSTEVSAAAEQASEAIDKVIKETDPLMQTASKLIQMLDRAAGDVFNASSPDAMKGALEVGEAATKSADMFKKQLEEAGKAGEASYGALEAAVNRYNQVVSATKQPDAVASSGITAGINSKDAERIVKLVDQYSMALGNLLDKVDALTARGGVISPASVDRAGILMQNLKAISGLYEQITGRSVDVASLEGAFASAQEMSANNKVIADLRKELTSANKSYDALITRITAVQQKDGVVKSSDIDRARQLDERLKSIEASMSKMGYQIDVPDRTAQINGIEDASNKAREIKAATKEVVSAQKEVDKLTARIQTLRNARDTALYNGRSVAGIDSRIRQVNTQLKDATMRLDGAKYSLSKINGDANSAALKISTFAVYANRARSYIEGASRSVVNFIGRVTGLKKAATLVHGAFSSLWRLMKYRLMRTFITDSLSELNRCYVYLAKADAKFNKLMNDIRTGWYNFKAAVSSAFIPLINTFGPAAINVMERLSAAVHSVGMALAALTGQDTYVRMTAQVGDYASSINDANGAAKKLQNTLAGFDTFNLLDDSSDSGSGSANAGGVTYKKEEIKLDMDDGSVWSKLRKLGEEVKALADSIKTILSDAWTDFASDMHFPVEPIDFVTEKLGQLSGWLNTNGPAISGIIANIAKIAMDLAGIIGIVAGDVINFVASFLGIDDTKTVLEKLSEILGKVHEWLSANKEEIAKFVEIALVVAGFVTIISTILGIVMKIVSFVSSIIPIIKGIAAGASALFAAIAAAGPLAIAAVVAAVVALGLAIWHAIDPETFKKAFEAVGNFLKNLFIGINNWIREHIARPIANVILSIEEFLTNLILTIKEKIEAVPGIFSSAFNGIKEGWNSLWSWFQDTKLYKFFDGSGDKVSSAFSKFSGSSGSNSSGRNSNTGRNIKMNAYGGRLNKGEIFIANERGPELLGKIGGKSTVANQNQAFDAVFRGIKEALSDFNPGGGDGDSDIYLEVNLDGDKVYNSVVKRNRQKTRQTGKNPLMA